MVYCLLWAFFYLVAGSLLARDAASARRLGFIHADAWIAAAVSGHGCV